MDGQKFDMKMTQVKDSKIGTEMKQVGQEKQVSKHQQPSQDNEDYNKDDYQFEVCQQQVSPLPQEEGMMEATAIEIEGTQCKESQAIEDNLLH